MNDLEISEDLIQFIWKYSVFNTKYLKTDCGKDIHIINQGVQNKDSGPDFSNSKIYIDGMLWIGNIEIHVHSKSWYLHEHHKDESYNNVILHVSFYLGEKKIISSNKQIIPNLSLQGSIPLKTLKLYKHLKNNTSFIPCASILKNIDKTSLQQQLYPLCIQRLTRKVKEIESDSIKYIGDIDFIFLLQVFKYFGAPLNKLPFSLLASSLNIQYIVKQSTSIEQIESLLFGLADLLHSKDKYSNTLENEFIYLRRLYGLKSYCKQHLWKFKGARPYNFPTIRIAQLAALLFKQPRLSVICLEITCIDDVYDIFSIEVSNYWKEHYHFSKKRKYASSKLSKTFINKLLINVLVPFFIFYSEYIGDESYKEKAISILESLPPENNKIITSFEKLNIIASNAFDSQAIIELYNEKCLKKRCLECAAGYTIIGTNYA